MFAVIVSVFVVLVVLIALARGADELFSTALGLPLLLFHLFIFAGIIHRIVSG